MHKKAFIIIVILLVFFFALSEAGLSQEQKGVLEPENANEARLNGLQPPAQVMDAIGIKPGMIIGKRG